MNLLKKEMAVQVIPHVALRSKAHTTQMASKWLHTFVYSLMNFHVTSLREGLVTEFALVFG